MTRIITVATELATVRYLKQEEPYSFIVRLVDMDEFISSIL